MKDHGEKFQAVEVVSKKTVRQKGPKRACAGARGNGRQGSSGDVMR